MQCIAAQTTKYYNVLRCISMDASNILQQLQISDTLQPSRLGATSTSIILAASTQHIDHDDCDDDGDGDDDGADGWQWW